MKRWINIPKQGRPTDSGNEVEILNLKQLIAVSDGDVALQKQLISMYILQSEKNLAVLSAHCSEAPGKAWIEASHILKGSSGNIGAVYLQKLCAQAERLKDTSKNERQTLYSQIKDAYLQLLQELGKNKLTEAA